MKKYLFFLLCLCFCSIVGCGRISVDDEKISVENTPISLKVNSKEAQYVDKLNIKDISSVEIHYENGKFYLSAGQMEKLLSLMGRIRYGEELQSEYLIGGMGYYTLYMQDGTNVYYDVIQWGEGGKCTVDGTWYEAEPESVLLEIDEMKYQLAEAFEKKFSVERYNDLKGNGERSIYYTKFRDRALATCNDEICGYIKQEMDKFDITKKMNVHLSNAVTELGDGKVLIHFHGSVRYRCTWEFEEISFTLLCDTKEKTVIPCIGKKSVPKISRIDSTPDRLSARIDTEDIVRAEFEFCTGRRMCFTSAQTEQLLSLLSRISIQREIEPKILNGGIGDFNLYRRDGSHITFGIIPDGCYINDTWYEAGTEDVFAKIQNMEEQIYTEYHEKFAEERYNGLKGNGERSIYYTKFRDRALASCNDEIYGYIKQEMDKLDITKKMNVHLSNAVTELDDGTVLMHFHGSVRYRSTWEFEEISFTLLCDTEEKRVIPYW